MLASSPVRDLGERPAVPGAVIAAAAGALSFAAVFFGDGTTLSSLVWIGGAAILLAALAGAAALAGLVPLPALDGAGAAYLVGLVGLAVWVGATTIWSISPDDSWQYTNRTLAYAAFALLGVLAAALLRRPAETIARGASALLAALFGWALLAKCVPALYSDYGRLARLRAPLDYWNELALLAAVAVPVALWLASRRYVLGVVLLYAAGTTVLLTYSRFGIALACLAAVAWIALAEDRVGGLAAVALASVAAGATFAVALELPGITKDGEPHAARVHDGWIFLLVLLAGVALVALAAALVGRALPVREAVRRRVERTAAGAGIAAGVGIVAGGIVESHRIWRSFANPVSSQIASNTSHIDSFSSSNRWRWWQEAWHAFLHHPAGGTGAGTFKLTNDMLRTSPLVATEPHNVPLQFLTETGIVGLLLLAVAAVGAVVAVSRTRRRAHGAERAAVTALALGAAVFLVHLVGDVDWDYVAVCGPLLFVVGALVVRGAPQPAAARRPLVAIAAVLFALGGVYSLAAPWLAQRDLVNLTLGSAKRAHAYDPLSTDALEDWAALQTVTDPARSEQLYHDAVSLEPENADTWIALGDFYWETRHYVEAYLAYSDAWKVDKFSVVGIPCGPLDQARHKVLGVWPPSCPAGRPASTH
jgi:O-Antigen ligase